jgi:hypothetical protein
MSLNTDEVNHSTRASLARSGAPESGVSILSEKSKDPSTPVASITGRSRYCERIPANRDMSILRHTKPPGPNVDEGSPPPAVIRQYSSTVKSVTAKQNREKVSLRTDRPVCAHHRPVRLAFNSGICRRISAASRSTASWDIKSERSRCQLREKVRNRLK